MKRNPLKFSLSLCLIFSLSLPVLWEHLIQGIMWLLHVLGQFLLLGKPQVSAGKMLTPSVLIADQRYFTCSKNTLNIFHFHMGNELIPVLLSHQSTVVRHPENHPQAITPTCDWELKSERKKILKISFQKMEGTLGSTLTAKTQSGIKRR